MHVAACITLKTNSAIFDWPIDFRLLTPHIRI